MKRNEPIILRTSLYELIDLTESIVRSGILEEFDDGGNGDVSLSVKIVPLKKNSKMFKLWRDKTAPKQKETYRRPKINPKDISYIG